MGKNLWKKWKRRYLCLVQVSQYTFVLCSYTEKKSEPRELMTLDNFTVDYADVDSELKSLGGRQFFNAVKEGDTVTFATDEEQERQLWIQALYRATGQSHKPTAPTAIAKTASQLVQQSSGGGGSGSSGGGGNKRIKILIPLLLGEFYNFDNLTKIKLYKNL